MENPPFHPFRSAEAKSGYYAFYDKKAEEWPVASSAELVSTSFGQTFVRVSGPVDAPALVLLPGMGSNSLMWIPNIQVLSESYRTFAVDFIHDYGRSIPQGVIKSSKDLLNWLDELFDALQLEKLYLMGLSYGAWLTILFALQHPSRLQKIVLLAPAATVLPVRWEFFVRILLCLLPSRYFLKSMAYWQAADTVKKGETGRAAVEQAIDHSLIAKQCFKPLRWIAPTVLTDEQLQSLVVPALYLVGENETLCSAQKAVQRLNRVAPQINTEIIPNAGHDLAGVQVELVNDRVLGFLKSVRDS